MNRGRFLKYALGGGLTALAASYTVIIERNIVQVNRYQIPIADLPPSFHGFTLAHLTDLHFSFLVSESFIENIVRRTNKLGVDIIVCTGDSVHRRNTTDETDKVWPILFKLEAKYGVYSVLGNHDHWADVERSVYWLNKTGQNIRHAGKAIVRGRERVFIGGAGDYWQDDLKIDQALDDSDEKDCRILLTHNPDSIDTDFNIKLSLVVSGHTHGGQVVIPFLGPPVLPVKNKRYSSGLITTSKAPIFISRGIGWAIYPVRFNIEKNFAFSRL
jgi:hypothetical protein